MLALDQPGQFHQAFELLLTPVALGLDITGQCLGQILGFFMETFIQAFHLLELFLQGGMLAYILTTVFVHRCAEGLKIFRQWFQQTG